MTEDVERTEKPCEFPGAHDAHQWGDAYGRHVCPGVPR